MNASHQKLLIKVSLQKLIGCRSISSTDWNYHEKVEKHGSQISTDKRPSVGKIKVPDFEQQPPEKPTTEKPITTGKVKVPNFVEKPKPMVNKSTPPPTTGKLKLPETFTRSNEDDRSTPLKASERSTASANNSANRGSASALKSKFENLIKESDSENQRKIEEERLRRTQKESMEKNKAKQEEEERQKKLRLEAEQRKSSEPPATNRSDESSDEEQVVSSKVNKIGVSVLPTQISAGSLSKQNSKASNRSSSYDSDTENNNTLNDDEEEPNVRAVEVPAQTTLAATSVHNASKQSNERAIETGETADDRQQESGRQAADEPQQLVDQREIDRLRELELQSELEEEELRKKLAEENDESLAEEDLSEEKEIRAVALYDYEVGKLFRSSN